MKLITLLAALALVAAGTFIYAAVNTMCDDDHWPDWE